MRTAAIRSKLSNYISIADEEKIKAMYVLFKDDINAELAWWQDQNLLNEFDADYKNWKEGKSKGYSSVEVKATLKKLQAKKTSK